MNAESVSTKDLKEIINNGPYKIKFPQASELEQDEEWCEVLVDEKWKKIRFHDYNEVFDIPGLYETIFYRTLMCNSPNTMSKLLNDVLVELNYDPENLRVMDFGAGNGMAGESLQTIGVRHIVGIDILEEAKKANWRDRPWVYDDYFVLDFTNPDKDIVKELKDYKFNCLTTVAALGFGDIPTMAFYNAFNLIADDGFIVFNLRDEFFKLGSKKGFGQLLDQMIKDEVIEFQLFKRYRHRINIHGEPLYYIAVVAKKIKDIPESMIS